MEQTYKFLVPLFLSVPILLSAVSYHKAIIYKRNEFLNLAEFLVSMALFTSCSWFLLPLGGAYTIISMLSWIWVLRTMGLISQNISGKMLFSKFHYYALTLGGIVSFILLGFSFPISMIAAPFSLSVGLIGLTFVFQAYSRVKKHSYSYLGHTSLFLIFSFFITRIFFPVIVSSESRQNLLITTDTFFLIAFSVTLYPLYSEIIFESLEKKLERVLKTRNRQLLTHSGFSEYKILSAGLSHEINNALTIINAKITQLMRHHPELERDLQVLHRATLKIHGGVRGLREFIYPREGTEVLDLEEVVNDVLKLYGQRLVNHGIEVRTSNLRGKLIRGQRVQIAQIFLSLINNSADELDTLEEKWISISAKVSGLFVEIEYKDSGRTNAAKIRPILSDPFYSFEEFMDNDIRLILVKEITMKYGGVFDVKDDKANTSFIIKLPLEEAFESTESSLYNKIDEVREHLH